MLDLTYNLVYSREAEHNRKRHRLSRKIVVDPKSKSKAKYLRLLGKISKLLVKASIAGKTEIHDSWLFNNIIGVILQVDPDFASWIDKHFFEKHDHIIYSEIVAKDFVCIGNTWVKAKPWENYKKLLA